MVAAALLLLLAPKGQARPVGEFLKEVPNRSVASELADAVVYASDPALLEARLPTLLLAEWKTTPGGAKRLERTRDQSRVVRAHDAATIRRTLAEGMRPLTRGRGGPFDAKLAGSLYANLGDTPIVGSSGFGPVSPAHLLLARLTEALAPRLESESRYQVPDVYALAPTAAERPLSPNAPDLVAGYLAVERELARLYAARPSGLEKWYYDRAIAPGLDEAAGDAERVVVSFYRDDRALSPGITVYRRNLSERTSASWTCPVLHAPVRPFRFEGESDALPAPPGDPALALLEGEPLDATVTPALDALSARLKKPVIVALPDAAAVAWTRDPPATLGAAVRLLEAEGVEFSSEDGALAGRPVDRARFGRRNLNRPALRRFLAAMRAPGNDWLRAWSRLYADSPHVTTLAPFLRETSLPKAGVPAPWPMYSRWAYKLLGTLNDGEWRSLSSGATFRLGTDPIRRGSAEAAAGFMARTPDGTRLPDAAMHRTWSVPNGLPPTTAIRLESGDQWVARTGRDDFWLELEVLADNTPVKAATILAVEAELGVRGKGNADIEFGLRGSRTLVIHPGGGLIERQEQADDAVRSVAPAGPLSKAPKEPRERLMRFIEENVAMWGKDGGAPPP